MEQMNNANNEQTIIRINAFGPLAVSCRVRVAHPTPDGDHDDGSEWVSLESKARAQKRQGIIKPITLLKVLLCQPARFAPHDLLMEHLYPDATISTAKKRLDDMAVILRRILHPDHPDAPTLELLPTVTASGSKGYQLAPHPLVWMDTDAFTWNIEQALRMARFADDPLPYWQRAYELATRGTFLADELYSDWAAARRDLLTGQVKQCVHRLSDLYRQRGNTQEAEWVLRKYVVSNPTDEDALRPLMELLEKQERYQEALEHYERAVVVLQEEKREPDERTRDVAEYVRTKQIKRERITVAHVEPRRSTTLQDFTLPDPQELETYDMNRSRRTLLQQTSGILGATLSTVEPYQILDSSLSMRLIQALAKPSSIDEGTFKYLETYTPSSACQHIHQVALNDGCHARTAPN